MEKLIVRGGKQLSGRVRPSGSKNAALPIIFSTLLLRGTSVIYNLPSISDVEVAITILRELGASVTYMRDGVYINTDNVENRPVREALVSGIRASSYLLGALLSRFGSAEISNFGGCNFENRPIDMHLYAAKALGAEIDDKRVYTRGLVGADIFFDKPSVGATVNSILLAIGARGKTRIFCYAKEPHVLALIRFLRSAGAKIDLFDDRIEIEYRALGSGCTTVISDVIEGATYLAAFMATSSSASVDGMPDDETATFEDVFSSAGARFDHSHGSVRAITTPTLPIIVTTSPYPGFPTDLQPQTAPLMALFSGGEITELVWRLRFGYLKELSRFGLRYRLDGNRAQIFPSELHSAEVVAIDLRAGAALLIAALSADGESVIYSSEVIRRGYADIVNKLRILGADIEQIT